MKTENIIEDFKQSQRILDAEVDAVEEYYYYLAEIDNQQFTGEFRSDIKRIIQKYGVDCVLSSIPEAIYSFKEEALHKLISIVICRNNPKTKANYILGIIKNKLHFGYVNKHDTSEVKRIVSDIVDKDSGKSDAVDYVIEQLKRLNPTSIEECINIINCYSTLYFSKK